MITNEFMEKYVSPTCEQFSIMMEGAVLSASTPGTLGVFDDNEIYGETF